jgi:hypothetical protein
VFLGEALTLAKVTGCVIILVGTALSSGVLDKVIMNHLRRAEI